MDTPSPPNTSKKSDAAPAIIIGREPLLGDILQLLNASEKAGIFLYGLRKIGKTSFLRHLQGRLSQEKKFIPCYIDLKQWKGNTPSSLMNMVLGCLFKAVRLAPPETENKTSTAFFQSQIKNKFLPVLPKNTCALVMFDECSRDREVQLQAVRRFYAWWGNFTAQTVMPLQTVVVAGSHANERKEAYEENFSHFHFFRFPLMTADETGLMIRRTELRKDLKWPDNQVRAVFEFTLGHPFLISLLCREIRTRLKKKPDVPAVRFKDVGRSYANALKAADAFFSEIWNGMEIWDALILSAIGEDARQKFSPDDLHKALGQWGYERFAESRLEQKLAQLQGWGFLQSHKGKISFRLPMFGRWVTASRPVSSTLRHFREQSDIFFRRAEASEQEGDWKKTAMHLIRTVDLNPDHVNAVKKLASAYLKLKMPKKAVELLKIHHHRFPSLSPLYIQCLHLLAKASDAKTEIAIYQDILEEFPGHKETLRRQNSWYECRGDALLKVGKPEAALEAFQQSGYPGNISKARAAIRRRKRLKNEFRRSRKNRFLIKFLGWSCALCLFIAALTGGAGYLGYLHFSEGLPKIHSLTDYHPPLVTTVYAADGRKIGEFFKERRIVIPLDRMSPTLIRAFISAEDARFFTHKGVDVMGIVRAFYKNMEAGTVVQGGSTITQQVVKSFLLTPERSYERKIKEAILAYRIDNYFSKEEILFLYLNQIYLGNGAYGVEAAAENYFGKQAKDLNLAECAMLAGLCQAPSRTSPLRDFKRAKQRQQYVLDRMVEEGHITRIQALDAFELPLKFPPARNYFLEECPYYTEHIRRTLEDAYGEEALYTGGLQIHTGIDPQWQASARDALEKGLKALESRHKYPNGLSPQGALICMEIKTGRVMAMVGGRDFTTHQFNRAIQAVRQPGSAFKPVIYAAAIDSGYTPASILVDSPIALPDNNKLWKPVNYDHKYYGRIPLRKALAKSRNLPVVKVLRDIGIDYAIGYAKSLGITAPLNRGLSLALGASGVSLIEMTGAYAVFANEGMRTAPLFITRMTDRFNQPMMLRHDDPMQVIEPSTAYIMNSLLQSVVNNGTGYKVKKMNRPAAGKTGTTNDFRDAWYIGYTPDYITGVWVGFDIERSLGRSEAGSKAACPVWIDFMTRVLEDKPVQAFKEAPEGVVFAKVEPGSGLLAASGFGWGVEECFKEGMLPKRRVYRPVETYSPDGYPPNQYSPNKYPTDRYPAARYPANRNPVKRYVVEPEDFFKGGM